MTANLNEILKMSVSERLLWVEAIWDSIASEQTVSNAGVGEKLKKLLDERLAEHKANPKSGASWEQVKARIKKAL